MSEEKPLRPLNRYLELGLRLFGEDFTQTTAAVVAVYLPVSALALLFHPPIRTLFAGGAQPAWLIPRMLVSQAALRLAQVLLFILLIQRAEARRRGERMVWDVAEALANFGRVAAVDLAYAFGLQLLAVASVWVSFLAAGVLLGESPLTLPIAMSVTAFVVITPAVRYYYCSLVSLLYGVGFGESFRRAAGFSSGAERLIVALVMTFLLVWFLIWQVVNIFFGAGLAAQLILQAAVMLTSVPYFYAGYGIFLDQAPRSGGEKEGGLPWEEVLPPGEAAPGRDEPPADPPSRP